MIKEAITKAVRRENLDVEMMTQVMNEIMEGEATDAQKASFLTALAMKGETIDEITAAARVMRQHCEKFLNDMDVLEIVGTGGDGANTINISTLASLVVSSVGIPVAKHGNRAASSKCGTADCLEALGVKNAMVVYGRDGMDEISLSGETMVCEAINGIFRSYVITPEEYGFTRCKKEELCGGTPQENAQFVWRILEGEKGPKTDAVLLNAGAAIHIASKDCSITEGIEIARKALESGQAKKQLERFITLSNQ